MQQAHDKLQKISCVAEKYNCITTDWERWQMRVSLTKQGTQEEEQVKRIGDWRTGKMITLNTLHLR